MSAWVAGARKLALIQELTGEAERAHADLVRKEKGRELEAWKQSKVYSPVQMGTEARDEVDTRWAPTQKEVDGKDTVEARLVAKGHQDTGLRDGNVDIAGCVSRRSSRFQLIPPSALRKWKL